MLKLLMKKLGTPEMEPPNVEGRGGVSNEGDTAFALVEGVGLVGVGAAGAPFRWTGVVVRGCGRWVRTSGAGAVVVSVVVVVGALVVPVEVDGVGSDAGGAGTVVVSVVVPGEGAEASGA